MKKNVLSIILSAMVLMGTVVFSACGNGDKLAELEAKLAQQSSQISALQEKNTQLEALMTQQSSQIETLEQEKQELEAQIEYLGSQTAGNIEFSTEWVIVDVKEEYKETFLNEEIKVEDFCWDNVERIEYGYWNENLSCESGSLKVYLIRSGEAQVLNAVNHFNTLDFVYLAWLDIIIHLV